MALVIECKDTDQQMPVEVPEITPCRLEKLSLKEISRLKVLVGKDREELTSVFRLSGRLGNDATIRWRGNLSNVHWIGSKQAFGQTIIESAAGKHVASGMCGGILQTLGSVDDYAGCELKGGRVTIGGDSGDYTAGCYPGAKQGMAGGELFVSGNAGRGLGRRIRRGIIAVAGSVGAGCGAEMLAGSIVVFGECGADCGWGMKRGTIVLVGTQTPLISPHFSLGSVYRNQILSLLSHRLEIWRPGFRKQICHQDFRLQHGDLLNSGKGEVLTMLER